MRITVITPSYNQGAYIEETIKSIESQRNVEVEHWVIDGGSSDQTVEILKRYPKVKWISEEDRGQSDALAKGLARSTGDIIGWINSDDYYERDCLEYVVSAFEDPAVQWVIGDLAYHFEASGEIIPDRTPDTNRNSLLADPDIVRQQCTFFRKELLERAGGWQAKYHMTMDYDLWMRLARISEPLMIGRRLAYFRFHGDQKTSEKNIACQATELAEIMRREGAPEWVVHKMLRVKRSLVWKLRAKALLVRAGLLNRRYLVQPFRKRQ